MRDVINQYALGQEAESIAKELYSEALTDAKSKDKDTLREYMLERAWEWCDGHEWVIYTYSSLRLIAECNTDEGEEWLNEIYDQPFDGLKTFSEIAQRLAFAVLYTAVQSEIAMMDIPDEDDDN